MIFIQKPKEDLIAFPEVQLINLIFTNPFQRSFGTIRKFSFIAGGCVKEDTFRFPGFTDKGENASETVIRQCQSGFFPGFS